MRFPRASGILLHPTSLPGKFGIGDLGPSAFEFCDLLAEARQTYWQILPLGPTGFGDSPYQCFSAFAGNPLLISPDELVRDGLIAPDRLDNTPQFDIDKVDYGRVYAWKKELWSAAYDAFRDRDDELKIKFDSFVDQHRSWLDDYALYRAVKASRNEEPWYEWPTDLKLGDSEALAPLWISLEYEIRREKFIQFIFFRQCSALKNYANGLGLRIVGDIPIFVALDSADVWCNQGLFKLNDDGSPKVVAGVPPDYFSKTGQLWGNPIYDWDAMRQDDFAWWTERVCQTLELVDVVRIDHFRGFAATWEVPGKDETAENGEWVEVPGRELFATLRATLGDLPVIAEDLGAITPDVTELRDEFELPGMRILQYAFSGDAKNLDLPHNYVRNCVAYTGTHDNDTVVGWFESLTLDSSTSEKLDQDSTATSSRKRERDYCLEYLHSEGSEINWDLIRAAWGSVADTAIVPIQDILGLGSEARMNLPATTGGNWEWRMPGDAIRPDIAQRLRELTAAYGRAPE
ncbi:MAG: 4-alpha-glucanotransferase [Acidobacteria bacterium]|nr:4-alpha-glucanotransferase [Acidobacteriota bacterium]